MAGKADEVAKIIEVMAARCNSCGEQLQHLAKRTRECNDAMFGLSQAITKLQSLIGNMPLDTLAVTAAKEE